MNARRLILPLIRFNLQMLPWAIWLVFVACLFDPVMQIVGMATSSGDSFRNEVSGFNTSLEPMSVMVCAILGMQFVAGSAAASSVSAGWLIPSEEFLLTLPLHRSMTYLVRIGIFFIVMLAVPALKVGLSAAEPDLHMSLYHSKSQRTEAFANLPLFQEQFPASVIVHETNATHDTLVIPHGAVLIALWQFWLVLLLALALQAATLPRFSAKVQRGILLGICLLPVLLVVFTPYGEHPARLENAFFLFASRWKDVVVLTLGAAVLIEGMVVKQTPRFEAA